MANKPGKISLEKGNILILETYRLLNTDSRGQYVKKLDFIKD